MAEGGQIEQSAKLAIQSPWLFGKMSYFVSCLFLKNEMLQTILPQGVIVCYTSSTN